MQKLTSILAAALVGGLIGGSRAAPEPLEIPLDLGTAAVLPEFTPPVDVAITVQDTRNTRPDSNFLFAADETEWTETPPAMLNTTIKIEGQFQRAVLDGLNKEGYRVAAQADRTLNVELQDLSYQRYGDRAIAVAHIFVTAKRGAGAYSRPYIATNEDLTKPEERSPEEVRELLQVAFQGALEDLLQDSNLTTFLGSGPWGTGSRSQQSPPSRSPH